MDTTILTLKNIYFYLKILRLILKLANTSLKVYPKLKSNQKYLDFAILGINHLLILLDILFMFFK